MTTQVNVLLEFIDCLITCEIALLMAVKDKRKVDTVVRDCALAQSIKCKDYRNAQVFYRVHKSTAPALMIYQFRNKHTNSVHT